MLLPFVLFFAAFVIYPLLVNLYYSFTNYGFSTQNIRFVGLRNYTRMLHDPDFLVSLRNTLVYAICSVVCLTAAGLGLSVALNRAARAAKALRVLAMAPYATSIAAVSLIWLLLLDPSAGIVNKALVSIGIHNPPGWLFSADWTLPSLIALNIWKNAGYVMLIFLTGLQGVSPELYEAATLDGADAFRRFLHVTLPSIAPVTAFIVASNTIEAFKTFEQVKIMTKGGPMLHTSTVVYQIYLRAFEDYQMGYAAALSTVLLLILLLLSLFQFKSIIKRPGE